MLRAYILKYCYIIASLPLILLFFHPILFADQTFFFRDIHRWFYPMKYFLGDALKNGHLPFWNPHYFCGSPFMSDIQSGVLYPFSLIFGLMPFPLAFNLFIIAHVFLAGLFFYLFIRRAGHSESAALVTSLSYAFGGCTLSAINVLNNLTTLVWLPAVLWSFQWARDNDKQQAFLLPVACLSCAILGGEPQLFIFITGLLFLIVLTPPDGGPFATRLKVAAAALMMVIAAVGITLIQLGPMYTDYLHSVRLAGLPFNEAVANSLPVAALKHQFIPLVFPADFTTNPENLANFFPESGRMPWLLSIYPGFLIVPLAIYGLLSGQFKYRRVWLVIYVIALLLALGDNTPFYKPFYKLLPVFRYPEKFYFISNFCLLVMAAPGIEALVRLAGKRKIRPAIAGSLLAVVLCADLYVSHRHLNPLCSATAYTHHHPDLEPVLNDPSLFRVFVDARQPPDPLKPQSVVDHHVQWQSLMMPNLGVLHGLHQVGGKTGLELNYQYFMTEILSQPWPQKLLFLKMANVKYIVSRHPLHKEPALSGLIEPVNAMVYRLKMPLPRAWLVGRIQSESVSSLPEFLKYDFDPAVSALGNAALASNHLTPRFSPVRTIAYTGNRIRIDVNAERPSVLVLSESAYPGWKVYVDGAEKDVLRLNHFFQGIDIAAGKHRVDFVFRPQKIFIFLALSVVSLIILLFSKFIIFNRQIN